MEMYAVGDHVLCIQVRTRLRVQCWAVRSQRRQLGDRRKVAATCLDAEEAQQISYPPLPSPPQGHPEFDRSVLDQLALMH